MTILVITLPGTMIKTQVVSRFMVINSNFIDLKDVCNPDGVVAYLFLDLLRKALAERQFIHSLVVGKRLDKI